MPGVKHEIVVKSVVELKDGKGWLTTLTYGFYGSALEFLTRPKVNGQAGWLTTYADGQRVEDAPELIKLIEAEVAKKANAT